MSMDKIALLVCELARDAAANKGQSPSRPVLQMSAPSEISALQVPTCPLATAAIRGVCTPGPHSSMKSVSLRSLLSAIRKATTAALHDQAAAKTRGDANM